MIAKRVPRRAATSSLHRVAHYILDTRQRGKKVQPGSVRVTNCHNDDPIWAIAEMEATSAHNTRSKNDRVYHLVVSFPAGERPTATQLEAIERDLADAIGLGAHQRLSTVHTDTANLHLHVVISKIHPVTHRCVEPYYDEYRLDDACRRLEAEHGLQRDNRIDHTRKKEELHHAQTKRGAHRGREPSRTRGASKGGRGTGPGARGAVSTGGSARGSTIARPGCRRRAPPDLARVGSDPPPEARNRLRDVSELRMVEHGRVTDVLLPGDVRDRVERQGPQADPQLRRHSDRAQGGGGGGGRGVIGRAADLEAHAGEESFQRWASEQAWPDLRIAVANATAWDDIHRACAISGLELHLRGAGLVLRARGTAAAMKPSHLDRAFSFASLTRRLGPYQPPSAAIAAIQPRRSYTRQPRVSAPALYAEYQQYRARATVTRKEERDRRRAVARDQRVAYAERRLLIRNAKSMSRVEKRLAYDALARERRAAVASATPLPPIPSWLDFLRERAAAGDLTALAALRARERKHRASEDAILRAPNLEAARAVVLTQLRPTATRHGAVLYRVADGGSVRDERDRICVDQISPAAVFFAIDLAHKRFGAQALICEGSAEFRAQVAAIAARHGSDLTFAAPDSSGVAHDPRFTKMAQAQQPATEAPSPKPKR